MGQYLTRLNTHEYLSATNNNSNNKYNIYYILLK